jgi:hypothetical protein
MGTFIIFIILINYVGVSILFAEHRSEVFLFFFIDETTESQFFQSYAKCS